MRTTTFNMSVALSAFRLAASFAWQPSRLSHLQFVQTMTTNIEALTGSPVAVTLTNYTGGSVVVTTQTAFEDNDAASAAQYANVMKEWRPHTCVWDWIWQCDSGSQLCDHRPSH